MQFTGNYEATVALKACFTRVTVMLLAVSFNCKQTLAEQ